MVGDIRALRKKYQDGIDEDEDHINQVYRAKKLREIVDKEVDNDLILK